MAEARNDAYSTAFIRKQKRKKDTAIIVSENDVEIKVNIKLYPI